MSRFELTMVSRAHATRLLPLALAGALALALCGALALAAVLAPAARADEYGGLGDLGAFTAGESAGHLEVDADEGASRAFGVDPVSGDSYIADEVEIEVEHEKKRFFRIQKVGVKGEYLAETRIEMAAQPLHLEGIAVDGEKERVYLLVVIQRHGESEVIQEKIAKDEEALEKKESSREQKRKKGESTEQVEKEIKELESKIKKLEEELPVFDPEAAVAAQLYAFSTTALEPAPGTLATGKEAGLLAGEKVFLPLSEEPGVSLLDPHGIAVDPQTHDVLILGQEDESAQKGAEELRAAVQRVHTEGADEGKLGPRYVDRENCLDAGARIATEPACAEGGEEPSSPFVSTGGRLYGVRLGELWEIPATEGSGEAFSSDPKVYETKPKRLLTLGREQGIEGEEGVVEPISEEEGGAAAFAATGSSGEGKIYLDANIKAEEGEGRISENRGVVVFGYREGAGAPEASELGWTAGQNGTGENVKCIVPLGNPQVLVGAGPGRALLFDVVTPNTNEHRLGAVNILQFGIGGEQCGHARATPPSASINGQQVTKLPKGKTVPLSLNVFAADALSVEWRFKDNGKEWADEPPVLESYPFPTQVPTLTHEFKHGGDVEIVAVVEPDDFGPKIEVHSNVTVEGGEETKQEEEAREKREAEEKKEAEAKEKREMEEKKEAEAREKREAEEKKEREAREKREAEEKKEAEAKEKREMEEKKEREAREKREVEEKKEIEEGKEKEAREKREAEEKKEAEAKEKREMEEKKEAEAREKREAEAKKEAEERERHEAEEKKEAEAKEKREMEEKKEAEAREKRAAEAKKEAEERGVPIGAEFSYTSPATSGQPARFAAKVTDPNNRASPHAQYKYVWEFGDGTDAEAGGGRELRMEHTYASEGRYEVKLEVTDEGGRTTEETHVVQVNAPRAPASLSSPAFGVVAAHTTTAAGSGGTTGTTSAHVAGASLAGTSLAVNGSGVLTLKVACPAGETSCAGTVTLRTLGVASASARKHARGSVLTLATGSFKVVGGRIELVKLRLSARARELLLHARSHTLRARVTLLARNPAGATHTTQTLVTVRLAKPSHRR